MKRIDYNIGDKVGECYYLGKEYPVKEKSSGRTLRMAMFKCRCGKEFYYRVDIIRKGRIKSCGCYYKESRKIVALKHGHASHDKISITYTTWENMIQRCLNNKSTSYKNYGAKNILPCKRWLKFSNFYNDMGNRPSTIYSLDRINNKKGYYKSNCRWATKTEQIENRKNTIYIEYKGVKKTLSKWVSEVGVEYNKTKQRLNLGWSIEKSFDYKIAI